MVPNSLPRSSIRCPSASSSSVGNGPSPTRVTYAFVTPSTRSIRVGPIPVPVQAAPAVGLDDVTKGYVPWSMSSIVPWAPSNSTRFPARRASSMISAVSSMNGRRRSAKRSWSSATRSGSRRGMPHSFSRISFFASSATSSLRTRIFGSSRSCARMPTRAALSS